MRAAYLIDGGFFIQKYKQEFRRHPTAADVKKFVDKLQTLTAPQAEIFRVYYYDCPPAEQEIVTAVSRTRVHLKNQPVYAIKKQFITEIKRLPYFAVREGILKFDGWEPKSFIIPPANDNDYRMKFRQKGVDMKIGLDIAWLSMGKIVERIVLVTGDSDFVPAMKFARRQGIQVCLSTLGHGVTDPLKENADCHYPEPLHSIMN